MAHLSHHRRRRRLLLLFPTAVFIIGSLVAHAATAKCVESPALSALLGDVPREGSCCQQDVCNIPCPAPVSDPAKGYGIAVLVSLGVSFVLGLSTILIVRGRVTNFFVAGRRLSLPVVTITLASQSIDSNALLGNADLSYKFHFYDGAVIPIGLGLSLILNALLLARHVHADRLLTLPDALAKRYGKVVEILAALASCVSFLFLLAGNLVGLGLILSYLLDISPSAAVWISTAVVWAYTACGGLFSVAYTDVAQGAIGWFGCLVTSFWLIRNVQPGAPVASRGFPDYIYPDAANAGGVCDLYDGVACAVNTTLCCFNVNTSSARAGVLDNGAFPTGDQRVFASQMFNPTALTPFPNAILWNWATIFILAFGNLAALDFQARCMASKTARNATIGCIIGGVLTFIIGIPFAYLGAITRRFYGPDSAHASFNVDSCSSIIGLPTCGEWVPDKRAFLYLLTHETPKFLGGWCLVGLVSASLSTSDGAILALGTVFARNVIYPLVPVLQSKRFGISKTLFNSRSLLLIARVATLPMAAIAGAIAAHQPDSTGQLLIVAFDVMLATVVVPLLAAYYVPNASPRAALVAMVCGGVIRILLQIVLPRDGSFVLPLSAPEFLAFGKAASTRSPTFVDALAENVWNPDVEPCKQDRFRDYSGVDSLAAFGVSILAFVLMQVMESVRDSALFRYPGDVGYEKDIDVWEDE